MSPTPETGHAGRVPRHDRPATAVRSTDIDVRHVHERDHSHRPVLDVPVSRPALGVVGLGVTSCMAVIVLLSLCDCDEPLRPSGGWMLLLIAVAFALAERFSFHLEYRREAMLFTLSEVPMALALVFLDPMTAIIVRLVSSGLMMSALRRRQPYKAFFNLSLYAFEMALAMAIVHVVTSGSSSTGEFVVLGAIWLGVAASSFAGMLIVSTAISMFEGGLVHRCAAEIRSSGFVIPLSAVVGISSVAPALVRPELSVLTFVPIIAVWVLLQRHGHLSQRFRDLKSLHGFSHAIGGSLDLDEIVELALERATDLLRAESGGLQVYGHDGVIIASAHVGEGRAWMPTDRDDPEWQQVFESRSAVWLSRAAGRLQLVPGQRRDDALVVPIVDGGEVLGLLLVADRGGAADSFAESDESSIETLASQLSTHVRKAIMHGEMEHAALHDPLTGDFNRPAFEQFVNDELVGTDCTGTAVLMLDLDKFKEVNDTLGHHVGDRVLVQFARRIRTILGPDDLFARFGGDEFALFVRRPAMSDLRILADQILTASYEPLHLDDLDVVVTTSIGIAAVSDDDRDAASVLRRADIAMYSAKNQHAGFEVYREEIDRRTPERLSLLGDLRDAIELGDLQVHFQPKIDLATSTVRGAEALVRWHHPSRGWVSPDDFIAVAEETGLIKRVTDQVLARALETARRWHLDRHHLRVAVNLSTHDLLDELLAERIARMLERHHVSPSTLTLEITESSLLADTPRTMTTIERLRRLGVQLSLDDFGTGYSSLSYLRRLPVTELKVDRSFVSNLLLDKQDEVIVRSTIDLGHNLGLDVVAEGIESSPVLDRLTELGCDIGQGYGISRPLPADLFDAWLQTTDYHIPRIPVPGSGVPA